MQIKKIFPLIFLGILLSCNDINESMVPNLQVKITLRLNNTAHQLNSAGGYHSIKHQVATRGRREGGESEAIGRLASIS